MTTRPSEQQKSAGPLYHYFVSAMVLTDGKGPLATNMERIQDGPITTMADVRDLELEFGAAIEARAKAKTEVVILGYHLLNIENAAPQKPKIENANQYQVTLDAARKFRVALEALESENAELLHPLLAQARLEGVRSVLAELEADLAVYENSQTG